MTTERALWIILGFLTLLVILAFDVQGIASCASTKCHIGIFFNKPW